MKYVIISILYRVINFFLFFKVALTGLSFLPTSTSGPQPQELVLASKLVIKRTISRTNVASVGSVFNDTRKVLVLSLPETIKEKRKRKHRRLLNSFA